MFIVDTNAMQRRQSLMTIIVVVACLFAAVFFPVQNALQVLMMSAAFLVVMPILYILLVLRQPLSGFGLTTGNVRSGWLWVAVSLPAIAVIVLLFRQFTDLFDEYFLPELVTGNFSVFILYEVIVVGVQVAIWEFFLRGFIIGGLRYQIGAWTILIAVVLMVAVSTPAMTGFAIAAPFAAIAAYYSRSIYYSFIITISTVLFIDMLTIAMIR